MNDSRDSKGAQSNWQLAILGLHFVPGQQAAINNRLNPFTAKDAKDAKEEGGIQDSRSLCGLRPLRSSLLWLSAEG
jgi:hypothetical protein